MNTGARIDQCGAAREHANKHAKARKLYGAPKKGVTEDQRAQPRAETQGKGEFMKQNPGQAAQAPRA